VHGEIGGSRSVACGKRRFASQYDGEDELANLWLTDSLKWSTNKDTCD
jgi:hypothetical protein